MARYQWWIHGKVPVVDPWQGTSGGSMAGYQWWIHDRVPVADPWQAGYQWWYQWWIHGRVPLCQWWDYTTRCQHCGWSGYWVPVVLIQVPTVLGFIFRFGNRFGKDTFPSREILFNVIINGAIWWRVIYLFLLIHIILCGFSLHNFEKSNFFSNCILDPLDLPRPPAAKPIIQEWHLI